MQAPASIIDLVNKFERNLPAYKSGGYNETQVRVEFINPFFEALGWDVRNKNGYPEQYKDVVHEFSLKMQEYSNAPDYLFKIGTMKKFFVEAKKPIIYIKEDIHPAYQLRRYAWSAKLPLSILTDFEEFAVYDCRIKPNQKDKASVARIFYFTFREYADKWNEIYSIFSKEAVLQGSFDKFSEENKRVKGVEVDDAFLKEIEGWREKLARNIALRNSHLSNRELNFAVQKTIDRIIFLRICEGRGIEEFKELLNLKEKSDIYKHLLHLFRNADKKYNSGLFHFAKEKDIQEDPDNITPALSIDDKILKEIIDSLYYPNSPYEFSVLGAEILGHVYEQFLGKVIRLTPGHQAKVEDKPEVKKAGGVYYTPAYIVEYIVKNTLGNKLEEIEGRGEGKVKKMIEEAGKLKVLDPACGSGSFLLGAYQYLLDWHNRIYQSAASELKERIYRFGNPADNDFRLTTKEKKRILLNNIFGVDIDSQAVEVSKLSLLLKVLEGETDETLSRQLDIFTERALPDLSQNIKCGNSLIDTDYYDNETLFEQETSVNPFNWQKGFPDIFKNGGFDVVIGNPPYFRIDSDRPDSTYLRTKFTTPEFKLDIYTLFIEKFVKEGFKKLGFIIPNTLLTNLTDRKLRKLLLEQSNIVEIVNYRTRVFKDAVVHTMILILDDDKRVNSIKITEVSQDNRETFDIKKNKFLENDNYSFDIRIFGKNSLLFEKLTLQSVVLSELCEVKQALKTGDDKKYLCNKKLKSNFKPIIGGSEIQRYQINYTGRYVDYGSHLACPRNPHIYEVNEKILIRETGKRITATYDKDKFYILSSLYSVYLKDKIKYSLKYILGVINSNLSQFFMKQLCFDNSSGAFIKARIFHYQQLPIKTISFDNQKEELFHNEIVSFVNQLLLIKPKLAHISLESERIQIQTKIDYCEDRINKIVYELYGLTEEEIKIIDN